MNEQEIRKLDITSILNGIKQTKTTTTTTTTTESVEVHSNPNPDKPALEEVAVEEVSNEQVQEKLDQLNNKAIKETDFINSSINEIQSNMDLVESIPNKYEVSTLVTGTDTDAMIADIIKSYNKKYNTNIAISSMKDAVDIAVNADELTSELSRSMISNTILSIIDYTKFSTIILLCQQLNTLVRRLIESADSDFDNFQKVQVIDRIFSWLTKLEELKKTYTHQNIDAIINRMESVKNMTAGGSKAVHTLLNLLKSNPKDK